MESTDLGKILKIEGSVAYEPELTTLVKTGILQPFPAVKLENRVEWVNEGFYGISTLGFEKGKNTPLAIGLLEKTSLVNSKPDRLVYCRVGHYRSGIISSNLYSSYQNATGFKYVDVKGLGHIIDEERDVSTNDQRFSTFLKVIPIKPDRISDEKTWGLADRPYVINDVRGMRKLERLGVRTVPIIAVTRIQEIVDTHGEKIPIKEAIARGIISSKIKPVEIFRAWVTPFRLQDVVYTPEEDKKYGVISTEKDVERKRNILRQAFNDMQGDLSIPFEVRQGMKDFDVKKYLNWLSYVIGDGLGKMHATKLTHGFLRALHNITLDGRFIDLDSNEGDSIEGIDLDLLVKDYKAIFDTSEPFYADFLPGIGKLFNVTIDRDEVLEIAFKAYYSHM